MYKNIIRFFAIVCGIVCSTMGINLMDMLGTYIDIPFMLRFVISLCLLANVILIVLLSRIIGKTEEAGGKTGSTK